MDRNAAISLDTEDPLASVRARFELPDDLIYLDGNSLGAPLQSVARGVTSVLDRWRDDLIGGWNAGWVHLAERAAVRVASVLGAQEHEVAVADSTSTNLFKALVAATGLRPERQVILMVEGEFPTDLYVASGLADLTGAGVRTVGRTELEEAVDQDVAVLLRSHVDYRTGARADLAKWTARAHEVGAVVVWDLSHSVGALDLRLGEWGADLAVGCSYKFLNGGPGAPAWIYAAERHHADLVTALRGWFGHAEPFEFAGTYQPAPDARRFQNGTPPILSLTALHEALAVWDDVDIAQVEQKAGQLTDLFIHLVEARCPSLEVVSPRDAARRGAQVSLRHPSAGAMMRALAGRGVVGDHRPPDILRFGFAPLYVRFVDVWDAVDQLADVLDSQEWERPEFASQGVVP